MARPVRGNQCLCQAGPLPAKWVVIDTPFPVQPAGVGDVPIDISEPDPINCPIDQVQRTNLQLKPISCETALKT